MRAQCSHWLTVLATHRCIWPLLRTCMTLLPSIDGVRLIQRIDGASRVVGRTRRIVNCAQQCASGVCCAFCLWRERNNQNANAVATLEGHEQLAQYLEHALAALAVQAAYAGELPDGALSSSSSIDLSDTSSGDDGSGSPRSATSPHIVTSPRVDASPRVGGAQPQSAVRSASGPVSVTAAPATSFTTASSGSGVSSSGSGTAATSAAAASEGSARSPPSLTRVPHKPVPPPAHPSSAPRNKRALTDGRGSASPAPPTSAAVSGRSRAACCLTRLRSRLRQMYQPCIR
jgi:hypothetical protein